MEEIVTSRLLLRRAEAGDLEAMHRVLSNEEAMRYWSTVPHRNLEETRRWLTGMIDAAPENGFDFVVEHRGRVIGKAGMWRLPEVGFIFHPDSWGKGIAFEALSAIIPAAFSRFPIPEITADVDPRNTASLRLLEKLGFAETGRARNTYRINGEWCDSIYLARSRNSGDGP